jgi:hypothetical protein
MNIKQNRGDIFDTWYNAGSFEANRQGAGNTYAEETSARLGVEAIHRVVSLLESGLTIRPEGQA